MISNIQTKSFEMTSLPWQELIWAGDGTGRGDVGRGRKKKKGGGGGEWKRLYKSQHKTENLTLF